ncbi:MAG: elongation factor G [Deinococcales bacterium]
MAQLESPHPAVRNVALLSHSGAGKTTLVEAMLYRSGAKAQMGSVNQGTTSSDFSPEEKHHQTSVYTSILPLTWKGQNFNLLDTPGYADFVAEIRGAQLAADAAAIVVSATAGVEVGTERVWLSTTQRELSTFIIINKMDLENASFFRTMAALEATLVGNIAALQVPIGEGHQFKGVVDLLHLKAYRWPQGDPVEVPIPEEVKGAVENYRGRLVEAIVETDDELLEKFLEEVEIDQGDLERAFHVAVKANQLTPVLLASASHVMGLSLLLDFMMEGVRDNEHHAPLETIEGEPPILKAEEPFSARVFKTVIDPYLGKVSMIRVLSGKLKTGDSFMGSNKGVTLTAAHLYTLNGKDYKEVSLLEAGMVGAINKLNEIQTGDTLCHKDKVFTLIPMRLPSPVMAVALYPKSRSDEDKMSDALHKLLEESPTMRLEHNPETHETLLWGMGSVQLNLSLEHLKERFGVDLETQTPKISYRETISKAAEARYRHKKQSGGAGQFAEVALRLEPQARGEGFSFVNAVVGGTIPGQFISSCQKGAEDAMREGSLLAAPVVDVKVTVFDGKDHPVDSKDIAFQTATLHAFREAFSAADPIILEPLALIRVRVPESYTGDILSDITSRRGRILGMDNEGSVSTISAHVPMAELQSYSPDLQSITGGRGVFSLKFDHYASMPNNLAERIIAARKA